MRIYWRSGANVSQAFLRFLRTEYKPWTIEQECCRAFAAQAISILVAVKIKDLGMDIPVFRSANLDGADAYNAEMMKRFAKSF